MRAILTEKGFVNYLGCFEITYLRMVFVTFVTLTDFSTISLKFLQFQPIVAVFDTQLLTMLEEASRSEQQDISLEISLPCLLCMK